MLLVYQTCFFKILELPVKDLTIYGSIDPSVSSDGLSKITI